MNYKNLLLKIIKENKAVIQLLNSAIVSAKYNANQKCSELTFLTKELTVDEVAHAEGKIGLVLWVDPEHYNSLTKSKTPAPRNTRDLLLRYCPRCKSKTYHYKNDMACTICTLPHPAMQKFPLTFIER